MCFIPLALQYVLVIFILVATVAFCQVLRRAKVCFISWITCSVSMCSVAAYQQPTHVMLSHALFQKMLAVFTVHLLFIIL